jgi:hypothetical protein
MGVDRFTGEVSVVAAVAEEDCGVVAAALSVVTASVAVQKAAKARRSRNDLPR